MSGFQAWDASGNLIVDLGDYTVRYKGRYNLRYPGGVQVVGYSIPGLKANNSFCTIASTSWTGHLDPEFFAKTKDGGFDLIYLPDPRGTLAQDFSVDVYEFI